MKSEEGRVRLQIPSQYSLSLSNLVTKPRQWNSFSCPYEITSLLHFTQQFLLSFYGFTAILYAIANQPQIPRGLSLFLPMGSDILRFLSETLDKGLQPCLTGRSLIIIDQSLFTIKLHFSKEIMPSRHNLINKQHSITLQVFNFSELYIGNRPYCYLNYIISKIEKSSYQKYIFELFFIPQSFFKF